MSLITQNDNEYYLRSHTTDGQRQIYGSIIHKRTARFDTQAGDKLTLLKRRSDDKG